MLWVRYEFNFQISFGRFSVSKTKITVLYLLVFKKKNRTLLHSEYFIFTCPIWPENGGKNFLHNVGTHLSDCNSVFSYKNDTSTPFRRFFG